MLVLLGFAACQSPARNAGDGLAGGGSSAVGAAAGMDDADAAGAAQVGGNTTTAGSDAGGGLRAHAGESADTEATAAGRDGDAVAITEPSLPAGQTYVPYTATIGATGGDAYAWTLASGTLPAGLELEETESSSVKIAGTPKEAGLFPVTLRVRDGSSTAELELTLAITHSVLFLSDRDVSSVIELFLSEVGDSSAPTPVRLNASLPSGGGVSSYAWSPDGSRVLYVAAQAQGGTPELWVSMLSNPGTAKRVSAPGVSVNHMAWLGSGNIAAYVTNVGSAYLVDLSGATPGTSKLALAASTSATSLVPSPNGASVTVTTQNTTSGEYTLSYLTWSATPQAVPLYAGNLPRTVLYSHDGRFGFLPTMRGSEWLDLSAPAPTLQASGVFLSWSPNADAVLLADSNSGVLLLGTFDGASLTTSKIVEPNPCQAVGGFSSYAAAWSLEGTDAVVNCPKDLRGVSDVANTAANSDFSLLPSGFASTATNAGMYVQLSAWSPDSGWIALRADRDVKNRYDLHLIRWSAPGTTYKLHANAIAAGVSTSAFSPNSQAIAFVGTISPQANDGLYLTPLPATGAPPLATLVSAPAAAVVQNDIAWLPGSRVLAYRASVSGRPQLFALPVAADGTPGEVVPISGVSGSGVTSYQLAPLR
jgi:hypothetical protein